MNVCVYFGPDKFLSKLIVFFLLLFCLSVCQESYFIGGKGMLQLSISKTLKYIILTLKTWPRDLFTVNFWGKNIMELQHLKNINRKLAGMISMFYLRLTFDHRYLGPNLNHLMSHTFLWLFAIIVKKIIIFVTVVRMQHILESFH